MENLKKNGNRIKISSREEIITRRRRGQGRPDNFMINWNNKYVKRNVSRTIKVDSRQIDRRISLINL